MIERIKQNLKTLLNDEQLNITELEKPSKNHIFLVESGTKKYVLKVYRFRENEEHLKSFEREKSAIDFFSTHSNKIKPIIHFNQERTPWILTQFFEGKTLDKIDDFELYKQTITLMLELHALTFKKKTLSETEIMEPYYGKILNTKKRIRKYLPEKFDLDSLIAILNNFDLCRETILNNSYTQIHGDFVNRNIIVNSGLNLIDFESARVAPAVEDLIFLIENSNLSKKQISELTTLYQSKIPFNNKVFLILKLLAKLRILGSLLKIKRKELDKFNDKIDSMIEEIKSITTEIKEKYDLRLDEKRTKKL